MQTQVVVIHGGDTFETYEEYLTFLKSHPFDLERLKQKRWKENLPEKLGEPFDVIRPEMPSKWNAKYPEWKIWFEKIIPFLNDGVVLVGHSLGGTFLAKYLSESKFPKRILATFLVAAPFDDQGADFSLADFSLPESLSPFEVQGGVIFLYHSANDPVVPFVDLAKYRKAIPSAKARIFTDRGHFDQEDLPELIEDIGDTLKTH